MHQKQKLNQIIERLNNAAENSQPLALDAEEVKVLAEEIGDIHYIPVLTMEQVAKLPSKPFFPKKD